MGERKLAASLIRSSIEDMVVLDEVESGKRKLARDLSIDELKRSRDWVANNAGVLSFEECCDICAPGMDWKQVQKNILLDPAAALERIRHQDSFQDSSPVVLDQTEAEIAAGDSPITASRLAMGLLHMIQPELDSDHNDDAVLGGLSQSMAF
ncbi:MAG: hypothetical protein EPN79_11375 [Burkholderiaceae bacterium]|nr:MAG: hypothetical protein EPN79_11375 [Burkholderiaceae bacterium]